MMAHRMVGAQPWLLNVNIPNRPDASRLPWALTRLGRRHASEPVIRQLNPRGETMYWIGAAGDAAEPASAAGGQREVPLMLEAENPLTRRPFGRKTGVCEPRVAWLRPAP